MNAAATERFPMIRDAADARADGGRRVVRLSAECVTIERQVQGVRMKVTVPVAGYRGLVLAVRLQAAKATLRLTHADKELSVVLAAGDAVTVAREARAWATFFDKKIAIEEDCVLIGAAFARQRNRRKPSRRSSFARRRREGRTERMDVCYAGEREIIART